MQLEAQIYLEEIERYEVYINNRISEIERLNELLYKITSTLCKDKVHTSPVTDKIAFTVTQIEQEKENLLDAANSLREVIKERVSLIEQLENTLEYKVIYNSYVKNLKLKDIAQEEGYTHQYICEVHNKALENFQNILNNLYKPIES